MAVEITWTKLKDGSWGLRAAGGELTPGADVTVKKKDGSTTTATVGAQIWKGKDNKSGLEIGLYTSVPKPKAKPSGTAAPARRSTRNYVPCGYPGCSPGFCDECEGEGRYSTGW